MLSHELCTRFALYCVLLQLITSSLCANTPSICPCVTPVSLCSHCRILKFSGVFTIDRAQFQKPFARDQLRYDPVILIGRSHSTNADHNQLVRSWIRNQTVCPQSKHDMNHSLGNLALKLRVRDWMKNVRLMISIHDVTMGGVAT